MHKTDAIKHIAAETGVTQEDTGKVIDSFFELAGSTVSNGEKLTIPGWIAFEQVDRKARNGRNPATGQPMHIPASKAIKVTAGSKLKEAGKTEMGTTMSENSGMTGMSPNGSY